MVVMVLLFTCSFCRLNSRRMISFSATSIWVFSRLNSWLWDTLCNKSGLPDGHLRCKFWVFCPITSDWPHVDFEFEFEKLSENSEIGPTALENWLHGSPDFWQLCVIKLSNSKFDLFFDRNLIWYMVRKYMLITHIYLT